MRKVIDMKFGEVDIATIKFDARSRDEIPKLLMGLQEIYCNRKVRGAVFTALRDLIPEGVKEIEDSEAFLQARRKHSAVESSINALENHGLDRCLDHGIEGFKRYVALAVVERNIQIMGHVLQQKKLKRLQQLEQMQRQRLVA